MDFSSLSPVQFHVHLSSVIFSVNVSFPIAGCAYWLSSDVFDVSASGGLHHSSLAVVTVTCLGALIVASCLYFCMHFMVLPSSTSCSVIVRN